MKCLLISHDDYILELLEEIKEKKLHILFHSKNIFLIESQTLPHLIWAQQIWKNCELIPIQSIGDAVRKLKSHKKKWLPTSISNHRRTALIYEQIPKFILKEIPFLDKKASENGSAFGLLDSNTLILSLDIFPLFEFGKVQFKETKEAPSRAYLKLWELFTLYKIVPSAGSVCLDLGSSPGGWTWVLSELGLNVISVDKALLDPRLQKSNSIQFIKSDAFKLSPSEVPKVDWFFSDIICEPEKLLDLIQKWKKETEIKNFVCTIKFKGKTNHSILKKFLEIEKSLIFHLSHNKHEVTWVSSSLLQI